MAQWLACASRSCSRCWGSRRHADPCFADVEAGAAGPAHVSSTARERLHEPRGVWMDERAEARRNPPKELLFLGRVCPRIGATYDVLLRLQADDLQRAQGARAGRRAGARPDPSASESHPGDWRFDPRRCAPGRRRVPAGLDGGVAIARLRGPQGAEAAWPRAPHRRHGRSLLGSRDHRRCDHEWRLGPSRDQGGPGRWRACRESCRPG